MEQLVGAGVPGCRVPGCRAVRFVERDRLALVNDRADQFGRRPCPYEMAGRLTAMTKNREWTRSRAPATTSSSRPRE
jgi:hypothetical protein